MVAKEDILAKSDFRPGTQARDDKCSLWEPMWPSTNILLSDTLNKHSVPSDKSYEERAAWFWAMWNCPAPRPLTFHSNIQLCMLHSYTWALGSLPLYRTTQGVSTQDTFTLSTFFPSWFPVCPTFPYFVIIVKFSQVKCCCARGSGCVL